MSKPVLRGIKLDYPAVELSVNGRVCQWQEQADGSFVSGDICMRISYAKIRNGLRKQVEITSAKEQPTPDYLIIDRQRIADSSLKMCGYVSSSGAVSMNISDEEGGGLMPGCGYPLIGEKFFAALEHQAGFNIIREQDETSTLYELRQHPVWQDGRLVTMSAVLVQADDPAAEFRRYLSGIRKKCDGRMLFSFCSFWSEPYNGNYEYVVSNDNYRTFVSAFNELGLFPDVYTLDAGWQDRNSIFQAKAASGGEAGLAELRRFLQKNHIGLSLWVSHNGPMGIAPEYLKSIGVAVGSGFSSTYRGSNFGVLLDEKLERLLTERFCELLRKPVGAIHFKMDWDNDCAVSDEFKLRYPSRNHVREASVNVQNRIALALHRVNPDVKIRHGWWPSPWQLQYADHIFLADSGDCEYSSIPSLNQRDCSFTARDIQYYHHFRRDRSMVPLDCIDNHDFPQAPRNPFMDDDAVLSNTALWAIMRGTSYQPWKIQPEALSLSQADILRNMMAYARSNSNVLCNGSATMTGGNPRYGEVYGFLHRQGKVKLLALRNPLPIPQTITGLPGVDGNETAIQIYPCCCEYGAEITFAPHEVKVFHVGTKTALHIEVPFQYCNGEYHFPSSVTVSKKISPRVSQVYQVPEFEISDAVDQLIPGGKRYWFKLRTPYRMKNCALQIRLTGKNAANTRMKLYIARDARATGNCYRVPYTEVFSGNPGRGENQNPENSVVSWGRFFNAAVPCGGNTFCRLELDDRETGIEVWASGYETPSFEAAARGAALSSIMQIPPHPYGFPRCAKMHLCGSEPEISE